MSNMRPWTRKVAPAWLPGTATAPSSNACQTASSQVVDGEHSHVASEGQDDDLDRLSSMYAAEAASTSRHAEQQLKQQLECRQKGMAQLRKDGLSKPLQADNK